MEKQSEIQKRNRHEGEAPRRKKAEKYRKSAIKTDRNQDKRS